MEDRYMSVGVAYVLGVIFAIVATVLACIYVWPQKRVPKMNKFMYALHNIVNFKSLMIEKLIKLLYIFSTCMVIFVGFFMLFSVEKSWLGETYMGGVGILLIVLGPILVRFSYEFLMMSIVLVEGVSAIRKKLCDDQGSEIKPDAMKMPVNYVFCTKCGTRYNENEGNCPNGCEK